MNEVPGVGIFVGSRCRPDIDKRTYEMWRDVPAGSVGVRYQLASCQPNEMCVGPNVYNTEVGSENVASCIPDPQYYEELHKKEGQANVQTCANPGTAAAGSAQQRAGAGQNSQAAVGISLTDEDGLEPRTAAFLQIEAQSENELFGATTYTTLPGGVHACEQCSSIGIYPLPKGTQRLHASYQLAGSDQVRMYWNEFTM
ncbi:hypothetical protein MMC20_005639 [Loxospora ochrophaea]|nr:hypothetical protein [Loxospora ochrophaea]